MTKEKKTFRQIESKTVCGIYNLLHNKGLVLFPIGKDSFGKVDSLVANISGSYYGQEIYTTNEQKAVAYLYFIIKNHPFTDGNKRTAVLTFEVVCELNDLQPNYQDFTLDELAVFIEKQSVDDHQKLISVLATLLFENN